MTSSCIGNQHPSPPAPGRPPVLVLWDVDHTLVDIRGLSRDIYDGAFQRVTGKPLGELADMTGRTERAILLDTLALHAIRDPETRLDEFYEALAESTLALRDRIGQQGHRLPGSAEALAAIARTGTVQTVVTGNIEPIARTKLEAFALGEHIDFEVGGYGRDGVDRADLVRSSRQRAAAKYRHEYTDEAVVVVGDTVHDVKGAHDAGVRAVAVATGSTPIETLAGAGPDAVLHDLEDAGAVVAAILGAAVPD